MRFILKQINKQQKLLLLFNCFLVFLFVSIHSLFPFLLAFLTNHFFEVQRQTNLDPNSISNTFFLFNDLDPINFALKLFGLILGLYLIGFVIKMYSRFYAVKISLKVALSIRNKLYNHVLSLSEEAFSYYGLNTLNNRLSNDINSLQISILNIFLFAFERVLIIVFALVYSLVLSPLLSLIYPIMIGIVLAFCIYTNKKSGKFYSDSNVALDNSNQIMYETILGNKIVRIFNLQQKQYDRFSIYLKDWVVSVVKGEKLIYNGFVILLFTLNSLTLLILLISGLITYHNYFLADQITVGVAVSFVNYLWSVIFSVSGVFECYINYIRIKPIIKRINEVLTNQDIEQSSTLIELTKPLAEKITFKNVSLSYEKDDILKSVNFNFEKNKIYGLIGPTGSGKSSVVNLLIKLYKNQKGDIRFDNISYKDISYDSIRNKFSIAFQEKLLFKGTIRSNLLMGKNDATNQELVSALKAACAYEFVKEYDDFLDHFVNEKGSNLSGGQKQRLSLARALLKPCDVLVLDDALNALDNLTRDTVLNNLKQLKKDKVIIIAGQQIKTISFADYIYVLNDGEVEAEGKHEELLKTSYTYKNLYKTQKSIE